MTDENDRPSIRPEVAESYSRYVDRVGRTHLHKMSVMRFIENLPSEALQAIPGEFWDTDVNSEGYTEAVISCPCHRTPRVELGRMAECECGRFFYNIGTDVFVGNSPRGRLAPWERIVENFRRNRETPAEP